jgi:3-oxoacyl-[acyl-carrier-protein] synthase II
MEPASSATIPHASNRLAAPLPGSSPSLSTVIDKPATQRVAITGVGIVSPLGNSLARLSESLRSGRSGICSLTQDATRLAFTAAGWATEFTGSIDDFGPLETARKRAIRKGLKLMCREIQMGVASAQLALYDAGLRQDDLAPTRSGVVFGCDHVVTLPEEFADAFTACTNRDAFHFQQWGTQGLSEVAPLWLLKYLPNMPASHIAIYNDLRGPNNSLTYREASSNLAIGEATETILRGSADRIVAGATGSSLAPLRAIQLALVSQYAQNGSAPTRLSRPFDLHRTGMVPAEGAGAILLEEFTAAETRGATIYGEILGHGSSMAVDKHSVADIRTAVANTLRAALRRAALDPAEIGHVHAHGAATTAGDVAEAQGIADVFGRRTPVTSLKGACGNLGAAGGMLELISSLWAIRRGELFPILNCDQPDPNCPVAIATGPGIDPGKIVISVNYTPQGQASAVVARGLGGIG